MHLHDRENLDLEGVAGARAKTDAPDPVQMKAALAGRPDVLGHSGLLGLQRAAGNSAAAGMMEDAPAVQDVVSGSGQPIDADVRGDLEARMGHDFSDVRVHTGDAADASARSVSAHAYTVGSNIVFQRGAYDPGSAAGQRMLAHELTHVVQQRSGPVDGTPIGGGISVSDPSDRFEREAAANAETVMSQPAPVQRHAEDEGSVQTAPDAALGPVQREEEQEQEEDVKA
ncbi:MULTISPECIES: DUF4157 domain-containing protein [Nocardioides]|uniref:DUF4157 domain-containing protein n=1 Tax=Nocardioides vastitatis TaxID=2568655 RepID=A0ABW0ZQ86_9ACTN|nr:DUF4157 domain-containing protein [Nocardioides sp.]THI97395.1 DUF4157 domain-containing protein [Nocardioides sp.]